MLNRIIKKILQKDISENVKTVDSLMKAVLEVKAPHVYYSFLQTQENQTIPKKTLEEKFDKSHVLSPTEKDIWIFGYGSLVWKADFPYIAKLPGFITGYHRKFHQNSIDHRGTPRFPGRVVTLIPTKDESSKVYGVAYRIAEVNVDEVLKHLDYREKNGYDRCSLEFHEFESDTTVDVIMYVATSQNDSFAGFISDENEIAEQIYRAVGPSGFNREYVYNLEDAMTTLFPGIEDNHLHRLVKLLRNFEEKDKDALHKCISSVEKLLESDESENVENEVVSLLLNFIDENK